MNDAVKPDRYAVMGDPIAHSISPLIHQAFAKATQQNLVYEKIQINTDGFQPELEKFVAEGGKGLNITLPLKQHAYALVDKRLESAEQAGAVNTIFIDERGNTIGSNTDGVGFCRDLLFNQQGHIKQQRILICGAGGAARGLIPALMQYQPACLHIVNRDLEKAKLLQQQFFKFGDITIGTYDETDEVFDLIINATSASVFDQVPPLSAKIIDDHTYCYDLYYSVKPTAFCRWALDRSAKVVVDGFGMLIEQAVETFYLWRGVRPAPTTVARLLQQRTQLL